MLAFACMLESAADAAGIAHPVDTDAEFDSDEYPHWAVLCNTQLGRAMQHGEHFQNAVTIAKLTVEEIKSLTYDDACKLNLC